MFAALVTALVAWNRADGAWNQSCRTCVLRTGEAARRGGGSHWSSQLWNRFDEDSF